MQTQFATCTSVEPELKILFFLRYSKKKPVLISKYMYTCIIVQVGIYSESNNEILRENHLQM